MTNSRWKSLLASHDIRWSSSCYTPYIYKKRGVKVYSVYLCPIHRKLIDRPSSRPPWSRSPKTGSTSLPYAAWLRRWAWLPMRCTDTSPVLLPLKRPLQTRVAAVCWRFYRKRPEGRHQKRRFEVSHKPMFDSRESSLGCSPSHWCHPPPHPTRMHRTYNHGGLY